MIAVRAVVQTPLASRYLVQLCKHFAHKIAVTYDTERGHADFPWGICDMTAGDTALDLYCEAPSAEDLERVKFVVTDHLQRFGWREKLSPDWQSETPRSS